MKKIKQLAAYLYKRPFLCTFQISLAVGAVIGMFLLVCSIFWENGIRLRSLFTLVLFSVLTSIFLVSPIVLTLYNIVYLITPDRSSEIRDAGKSIETLTWFLGTFLCFSYAPMTDIQWDQNWSEQLYNSALHTPLATWTLPTIIAVAAVAVIGYLILRSTRIHCLPPLLAVLAIGGMYLGAALCVVWILQLLAELRPQCLPLCLYPFNLILIAAKTTKEVILDYEAERHPLPQGKSRLILTLHRLLANAKHWPWLAVLGALPLLGILIAVLTLFGQAPDSIIHAWTQTSDWTFSQQVAPQNIYQDMHYLCTVSAGGHKKLVKPIRVGKRHGHRVLVNRQLCIANAFEQLLEERIPCIHRMIRGFYDRYGYPIAKHIHSPYTADAIWLLMKPLEWFFLAVLYLFDPKPENRIAVQYPHSPPPEIPHS